MEWEAQLESWLPVGVQRESIQLERWLQMEVQIELGLGMEASLGKLDTQGIGLEWEAQLEG
jgi:hypothetical protein